MTMRDYGSFDCERFADHLMDHIEGDDDAATRIRMETHAASCDACAALLADIRAISHDATTLPVLTPSRDLWPDIAARIEAPVLALPERNAPPRGGRRTPAWFRPAAAAAALVIATAGITYVATRTQRTDSTRVAQVPPAATPSTAPGTTVAPDTTQPIAAPRQQVASAPTPDPRFPTSGPATPVARREKLSPEATYDLEIGRLRDIVRQRRSQMDTATFNVIDRNLKVIDDAIAQCRAALARDPNSRFLLDNLNGALDTKVRLLRTAAMLPART